MERRYVDLRVILLFGLIALVLAMPSRKESLTEIAKLKDEISKLKFEYASKAAEVEGWMKSAKAWESEAQKLRVEATNNTESWHREATAMVCLCV